MTVEQLLAKLEHVKNKKAIVFIGQVDISHPEKHLADKADTIYDYSDRKFSFVQIF